jgi:hypothetical protein
VLQSGDLGACIYTRTVTLDQNQVGHGLT